jgi:hypothetical protein
MSTAWITNLGIPGARDVTITRTLPASTNAYNIPDPGASCDFVMTAGTQTINGAKTFGSKITGTITGHSDADLALTGGTLSGDLNITAATANLYLTIKTTRASSTAGVQFLSCNNVDGTTLRDNNGALEVFVASLATPCLTLASTTGTATFNDKVGIGIAPNAPLHVKGSTHNEGMTLGSASTHNFAVTADDGAGYGIYIGNGYSGNSWIQCGRTNTTIAYSLVLQPSGGNVLQPSQPSFLAEYVAGSTNVTGDGTNYTMPWDTEVYDQGGNFASNTFTAPVTGRYLLTLSVSFLNTTTDHVYRRIFIVTSNRSYAQIHYHTLAETNHCMCLSVLVDMDASDTAYCTAQVGGTGKTVDILDDGQYNQFSGSLIN